MTPHGGFGESDDAEKGPTCQQGIYDPAIAKIGALEDRSHRHYLFHRDCGFLSVYSASTCGWDAGYEVRGPRIGSYVMRRVAERQEEAYI